MKSKVEAYFLKNKSGQFFRVQNERKDSHDQNANLSKKISLEFQIMLGTEEKHFSAKIYGVIDAIGTLGGVHEIVLWCIMLFYGSLRKHVYLFSIINRLIQTEQLQDTDFEDNNEQQNINQTFRSIPDKVARQCRDKLSINQVHNYNPVHKSEVDIRPRMFRRQKTLSNQMSNYTSQILKLQNEQYSYCVLLKS